MIDPLLETIEKGDAREIFARLMQRCEGMPPLEQYTIALNLIVNTIRMTTPYRAEAERVIDDIFRRGKSVLLDQHYDAVTGRRRTTFAHSQMVQAPFVPSETQVF